MPIVVGINHPGWILNASITTTNPSEPSRCWFLWHVSPRFFFLPPT